MIDCPICQISAGTIPAWIVYRDPEVVCFLPKEIEVYGHTVIAPIQHCQDIYAAESNSLGAMMGAARMLARHYREQIGASGVNLLHASGASAQQTVNHIHIHLIPRFDGDGVDAWPSFSGANVDKDELLTKLKFTQTDLRE